MFLIVNIKCLNKCSFSCKGRRMAALVTKELLLCPKNFYCGGLGNIGKRRLATNKACCLIVVKKWDLVNFLAFWTKRKHNNLDLRCDEALSWRISHRLNQKKKNILLNCVTKEPQIVKCIPTAVNGWAIHSGKVVPYPKKHNDRKWLDDGCQQWSKAVNDL